MDLELKDIHVYDRFGDELMTYRQIKSGIIVYRNSVRFQLEGKQYQLIFPDTSGIKVVID